jgi:hypothetical protein
MIEAAILVDLELIRFVGAKTVHFTCGQKNNLPLIG